MSLRAPVSVSVSVSLSVSVLSALLLATAAPAQERFTLTGRDVAIYNLAGTMHITTGSGNATEVEVTRVGKDANQLRVATGTIDGSNTLRVIYPADDIIYPSKKGHDSQTNMRVNDDGTFGRGRAGRRVSLSTCPRGGRDALEMGADLVVRVPAGVTLLARLGVGQVEVRNVNGNITVDNSAGSITALGTRGELTLNTASGDIAVSNAEGDVNVSTASGGVRMEDVNARAVKVDVASGGIEVEDVRAPRVDLETASGQIRVRALESARVKLSTASGAIEADLTGKLENADIETASGFINVRVPRGVDATLDVETASGSIDVDLPIKITTQRRNELRGTLGAGTGRISLSTASGSIKVDGM